MIFCLVRTSGEGKPQEGISFLLIDMKSPGVTVRPIVTIGGKHEVNDVFFDDVRVPAANRVGKENKGWTMRNTCCGSSAPGRRMWNAAAPGRAAEGDRARERLDGRPLIEDRRFAGKLADLEISWRRSTGRKCGCSPPRTSAPSRGRKSRC